MELLLDIWNTISPFMFAYLLIFLIILILVVAFIIYVYIMILKANREYKEMRESNKVRMRETRERIKKMQEKE